MTRIIFLDLNCILQTEKHWPELDKEKVHLMSELCFHARANVVVIGEWSTELSSHEKMAKALGRLGYFLYPWSKSWIADNFRERGVKINKWVKWNRRYR